MRQVLMRAVMAAGLASGLTAGPAWATGPVSFDDSWRTQAFSLFSSNSYDFRGDAVSVASDGSVSLAYRPLPERFWSAQGAGWAWEVTRGVPATDLRRKGGDDRNLALYFVFLPQDEAERLRNTNVRRLLRNDAAHVLVYVWGGAHDRGAVLDSPYLGPRGKTVVLRPSGTGQARERVDLGRDYARIFGGEAALVGLAVSGDSDDTDTAIRGEIRDLSLQ
jgi:hypothetical protein